MNPEEEKRAAQVCEAGRRWRSRNPEKARASSRRYRAKYPERRRELWRRYRADHREELNEKSRRWQTTNREKIRSAKRARRYGLSEEAFQELIATQRNACPICCTLFEKELPHIDHDHDTGQVRGILCGNCNRAIGLFRDNPFIMASAIMYLRGDFSCSYAK